MLLCRGCRFWAGVYWFLSSAHWQNVLLIKNMMIYWNWLWNVWTKLLNIMKIIILKWILMVFLALDSFKVSSITCIMSKCHSYNAFIQCQHRPNVSYKRSAFKIKPFLVGSSIDHSIGNIWKISKPFGQIFIKVFKAWEPFVLKRSWMGSI